MNIEKHPIEYYFGKSFVRYGDGEFGCMFNPGIGANCDGHFYYKELSDDLNRCFKADHGYLIGLQRYALNTMGPQIKNLIGNDQTIFHDSDVFHRANFVKNGLASLIEYLRSVNLCLMGPAHLKSVAKKLNAKVFIEVPSANCYLKIDELKNELINCLDKVNVVSISASMMANVIIHDLYKEDISFLDLGSLWDPYAGVLSRTYHKGRSFIL